MYRIRFHGRGGQGMKTASRLLGKAFFLEGFEVQDAPRYGAERRGAPIFAYVRANRGSINARGIIHRPDLVIVADDTLVRLAAAGVLQGCSAHTILLIHSATPAHAWRKRIDFTGQVIILPSAKTENRLERPLIGSACAGAAARLVGIISRDTLEKAIRDEFARYEPAVIEKNRLTAVNAYERMADHAATVTEVEDQASRTHERPAWIEPPFESAGISAPVIHAAASSAAMKTGLWRTMRPVIDHALCRRCAWICGTYCPDGAIIPDEKGYPQIDYEHCKGCLICKNECPFHAIGVIPEKEATSGNTAQGGLS